MDWIKNQIILGLLVFSVIVLTLTSSQYFIDHINSDYLYIYETVYNVIHFGTIRGQDVPPAPYYFPDLLVIYLLNFITENITILHLFYSVGFLLAYIIFVFKLIQTCVNDKALARLGSLIALVSYFFLIMPGLYFLDYWPSSHLSLVLFSLYFLTVYIKNSQQRISIGYGIFLLTLTFLVFISDNLLFAQFLFPFLMLVLVDRWRKKISRREAIFYMSLFLCVVLAGAKIDVFFEKFFQLTYSNNVSLFRIRKVAYLDETVKLAGRLFLESFHLYPMIFLTIFSFILISVVLSVLLYLNRDSRYPLVNLSRITMFFCIAVLSNVILAILVGKFTDVAYLRYFDIIYIFPCVWLSLVMVHVLQRQLYVKVVYALMVGLIIVGGGSFGYNHFSSLQNFSLAPPYNPHLECVDHVTKTFGLNNGLAEYWSTKTIRRLSKQNIRLSQIDRYLNFLNFTDNQFYFYSNLKLKTPLNYQFIIVNNLPKAKIENEIGKPDKIVNCSSYEIWLYIHSDSQEKLNRYFSSKIRSFV